MPLLRKFGFRSLGVYHTYLSRSTGCRRHASKLKGMSTILQNRGLEEINVDEQRYFDSKPFPLMVKPVDRRKNTTKDWCDWVKENKTFTNELLLEHVAIIFRDFQVKNAEDFDNFVKSFGYKSLPYIGGAAVRNVVVGDVFTANESPPDYPISFHHELAQVPDYPNFLFFYCDIAPQRGGQTPIVLSNLVYTTMQDKHPDFVAKLKELGVRYTRMLPNGDDYSSSIGRGWQSTYLTEDREEAEARARKQGTHIEWLPDGGMKTVTKVMQPIQEDDRTGKTMWFNSMNSAYWTWGVDPRNDLYKGATFGDDSMLPKGPMTTLKNTIEELAVDITWKHCDIMMVDNNQALHARRPFTPPRRILASLCV